MYMHIDPDLTESTFWQGSLSLRWLFLSYSFKPRATPVFPHNHQWFITPVLHMIIMVENRMVDSRLNTCKHIATIWSHLRCSNQEAIVILQADKSYMPIQKPWRIQCDIQLCKTSPKHQSFLLYLEKHHNDYFSLRTDMTAGNCAYHTHLHTIHVLHYACWLLHAILHKFPGICKRSL